MEKLKSLTIFFPFLNDEKNVNRMISDAYKYGKKLTDNLEVIAIHGGNSTDKTLSVIKKQKKYYPELVIIDKTKNIEGYAVIRYGFYNASKDWVFYTDGDGQYDVKQLEKLVTKQLQTGADVVNGYKLQRSDSLTRKIFGSFYKLLLRRIYNLPVSDIDCDFRLIRRRFLKNIKFRCSSAAICLVLINELKKAGAKFAEVPVYHSKRKYGKSQFFKLKYIYPTFLDNLKFFFNYFFNTSQ